MANTRTSPFDFTRQDLDCVVGGLSALDVPRLNIENEDEARQFLLAYGYDITDADHASQLWAIHRRAVSLIRESLMDEGEVMPEKLSDPAQLLDITQLLVIASSRSTGDKNLQKWACGILRVMHVYVHLRNDLFSAFQAEIQTQILKPLQEAIQQDEIMGSTILGPNQADGGVRLHRFEIKPFKTTSSSVIKLLARPERAALTLLDKLGVRFVTRNVFDAFRVLRYMIENHLLSYPHIMPDQSNNTLYPVNLFCEAMGEFKEREQSGRELTLDEIQELLKRRLDTELHRAEYRSRHNEFSDPDYRFIKLINRKLVTASVGDGEQKRTFRFFYPFEIQIMDQETYVRNLSGPMAHDEYKSRQRARARERVFGLKN